MPGLGILIVLFLLLPIYAWQGWPKPFWLTAMIAAFFAYWGSRAVLREWRTPNPSKLQAFYGRVLKEAVTRRSTPSFGLLLAVAIRSGILYGGLAGAVRSIIFFFESYSLPATPIEWARLLYLFIGTIGLFTGFGALIGVSAGVIFSLLVPHLTR